MDSEDVELWGVSQMGSDYFIFWKSRQRGGANYYKYINYLEGKEVNSMGKSNRNLTVPGSRSDRILNFFCGKGCDRYMNILII